MARRMVQVYADFATDVAAMPVVVGVPPNLSRASLLQTWAPQLCGDVLASQAGSLVRRVCMWLSGRKSRLESFAGANKTLTIEAMMGDRRALQVTH